MLSSRAIRSRSPGYPSRNAANRSKKGRSNWAKEFLLLVLETSSIHGFNHVANKKTHPIENVLWIISIIVGAYGAYYLAQSTLARFNDSPTVISLERNYKDWNTTFPAVTICPAKKIDPEISEELIRK
ncbi:unnamed protein product, partial [Nesidiocoris tenuis]